MSLLNLAQAKQAVGTKPAVSYAYNGPGSWAIPVAGAKGTVAAPTMKSASIVQKPVAAPAKKASTPPYTVPMFVPIDKDSGQGPKDRSGVERPMHMANVDTRGHAIGGWMGFGAKGVSAGSDSYTGLYSNYFWAASCFMLTIVTYFVHPAISAVFAYLWGHFWSEYLVGNAWGIEWLKGKSLIHAY